MESVIVLSIVIDRLANKDALLAWVVVFPLMVNLNVLLHHTVLARLEWTPGANTPKMGKKIYFMSLRGESCYLSKLSSP